MDEHYFLVAIKTLSKQIDSLEFINQEYQKEIAKLNEQINSLLAEGKNHAQ